MNRLIAIFIGLVLIGLSGCSKPKVNDLHILRIPSSKPYNFITWSPKDTEATQRQVRAHNRRHQAVVNAEKEAVAKAKE